MAETNKFIYALCTKSKVDVFGQFSAAKNQLLIELQFHCWAQLFNSRARSRKGQNLAQVAGASAVWRL